MANCVTCDAICERAGQHHVKTGCISYVPKVYPKPRTNYDSIVSKSPENLAVLISENIDCGVCENMFGLRPCSERCCLDFWFDWLKQDVQE